MIKSTLKLTHQHLGAVLKSGWLSMLAGTVILEIPVQGFYIYKRTIESELGPGGAAETIRIINTASILLIETFISAYIMFSAAIFADSSYKNTPTNFLEVTKKNLIPLTIESLRALGKTILGFVLFIIPGLYFYVRYSQVPFVVIFSDAYKAGKADALKLSSYLTQGKGVLVTMFLLLTGTFSFYLSVLKDSNPLLDSPLVFGVCFLVNFLVQVYIAIASYFLYHLLMEDKKGSI
ncbi:MAG: hypothetical protein A4S09_11050 [Proteobacteria bacterium SG_bin7]|nr:MAG: hypothetical protein A4S09_11050 [Proteobacteria bacterium SG_bin7]